MPNSGSKKLNQFHPVTGHKGPEMCKDKFYSFFNLDDRWEYVINAKPRPFIPGKETAAGWNAAPV
jgi:hypothetical protein